MKTQHCDQCRHATMRSLPKPVLICAMLHKPRFYAPVYWMKDTWGWKRKCEDFLAIEAKMRKKNAAPCRPLTDDRIWELKTQFEKDAEMKIPEKPFRHVVRAIEAAHGIKENT